jgi:site-specific DNA recombinase
MIALYVRVSTQQQQQTQTIEQQLERLQHYAQTQGWSISEEHIFRDDGYSGASLKRPGLDRLRDQIALAQVDKILITAPDRLARNFVHQTLLIEELQKYGCLVEFLEHPMSQDPHDQLLLQIRGAVAEYERTLISERMRRGRLQKLQAGSLLPWTFAPYGYSCDLEHPRDPRGVSLNPAEAIVIREIFACYTECDYTLLQLSQHLHQLSIPSPRSKPSWTSATLRGILMNPVYIGQVYGNRTQSTVARQRRSPLQPISSKGSTRERDRSDWILVTQIPAIISAEQFEVAQVKLRENQQNAKRNNKTNDYLLRALVSCGCCQGTCISAAKGQGYRYYLCRSKTVVKHLIEAQCQAPYAPAEQLETLVWNDLCTVLKQPEMIAQAMERLQNGECFPQELQARQLNLKQGQKTLQQQLERLTQAYLNNIIQLEEYQRRRTELEQRQAAFLKQQQQLETQADRHLEVLQLKQGTTEFCQRVSQGLEQADFAQKRRLVELLIDRVIVTRNEVEIRYVIPTNPRGENTRFCHLRIDYFNPKPFGIGFEGRF